MVARPKQHGRKSIEDVHSKRMAESPADLKVDQTPVCETIHFLEESLVANINFRTNRSLNYLNVG